jgi:hypothetical protein
VDTAQRRRVSGSRCHGDACWSRQKDAYEELFGGRVAEVSGRPIALAEQVLP